MDLFKIIVLSIVQGLAELLPVSSSAHVIVVEKLMGLDPASPEMTFLLVMLHSGTMLAVIVAFWSRWKALLKHEGFMPLLKQVIVATLATGVIGYGLKILIERFVLGGGAAKAEIEQLFANTGLIATALTAAGVLILIAGFRKGSARAKPTQVSILGVGVVQGLCLPFRGFSRSGATISTALLFGLKRGFAEDFSFLLAVVLTPPVVARELLRLMKEPATSSGVGAMVLPGVLGAAFSFAAGLLAIRWLSRWLETGKWYLFGFYCLFFAAVIVALTMTGFI